MPDWLGSASPCCVTPVESSALSGTLSWPVQESCHTALSFKGLVPGPSRQRGEAELPLLWT